MNLVKAIRPKCGIEDCNRPHYSKGYCQAHYNRIWQAKSDNLNMSPRIGKPINKVKRRKCTFVGCKKIHYAKGLCQYHYMSARSAMIVSSDEKGCSVEGCKYKHSAKNFCRFHYDLNCAQGRLFEIRNESDYESEIA